MSNHPEATPHSPAQVAPFDGCVESARAADKQKKSLLTSLTSWLDAGAGLANFDKAKVDSVDWLRVIPFIGMHLACFAVLYVGVSTIAVVVATSMYVIRMFAITGFYHRYFSHRSFKTSRAGQFVFALLGASAVQRGPIWWAAHHRHHHAFSDTEHDVHSPVQRGFCHAGISSPICPECATCCAFPS
jgi:stearoyl-CoA desaturase (delta-9 desaturase)